MEKNFNNCQDHPDSKIGYVCKKCKDLFCQKCIYKDQHQKHMSKIQVLSPSIISNYHLLACLGSGTFGVVYKVYSPEKKEVFALKEMRFGEDDDKNDMELLELQKKLAEKEWQLASGLNHQNIIKTYSRDFIAQENLYVILMELAECSLNEVLGQLANQREKAYHYFKQICEGLYHLHVENSIIHRDLKPENILIINDMIKICDFGESKQIMNQFLSLSRPEGFGTPMYDSPEVLNLKKYSNKTDVWALGIIFHQMLTNNVHPFDPESKKKYFAFQKSIKNYEISISPSIKEDLYLQILQGCLKFDDSKRWDIKQLKVFLDENEKIRTKEINEVNPYFIETLEKWNSKVSLEYLDKKFFPLFIQCPINSCNSKVLYRWIHSVCRSTLHFNQEGCLVCEKTMLKGNCSAPFPLQNANFSCPEHGKIYCQVSLPNLFETLTQSFEKIMANSQKKEITKFLNELIEKIQTDLNF